MIYSDGRPHATVSRCASSCRATSKCDNCNGDSSVAAASQVSADNSTAVRAYQVRTHHTLRAALLRAASQIRAHCPVFWPPMAHERTMSAFVRLDD